MKLFIRYDENNTHAQNFLYMYRHEHEFVDALSDAEEFHVIGGDGTLIRNIANFNKIDIPVGLIGTGTVNYLAMGINPISTEVHRLGCDHPYYAPKILNEFAFKTDDGSMAKFDLKIDGELVYDGMRGDGLIIATSVGSTAYAMSAGGPIVQIGTPVHIIVPNNEYSRHSRPLVISNERRLTFTPRCPMVAILDGSYKFNLQVNKPLDIRKSDAIILKHQNTLIRSEKR